MNYVMIGVASFAAGFVSALGLGGGGILVLLLTVFLQMPQTQAGGINLLFFLPVAAVSIFIHVRNHYIHYKFALKCAPFGVLGAWLGVYVAGKIQPGYIIKAFAVFVLILGIRELFAKKELGEKSKKG